MPILISPKLFNELKNLDPNGIVFNKGNVQCSKCSSSLPYLGSQSVRELWKNFGTFCIFCIEKSGWPAYLATSRAVRQASIHDAKMIANFYSGKLVSQTFETVSKKLLWKCKNGHRFERSLLLIKTRNSFCTSCTGYLGEEIARSIFQNATGQIFSKTRSLNWLVNPETGYKLELDGYCSELNIAFEHQGSQHYGNHRLIEQNDRTPIKRKLCAENGIELIEVPSITENFGITTAIDFITSQLKILGLKPKPVYLKD